MVLNVHKNYKAYWGWGEGGSGGGGRRRFCLKMFYFFHIVQELCESRGGHPGLSVLMSLLVSVDVKLY